MTCQQKCFFYVALIMADLSDKLNEFEFTL